MPSNIGHRRPCNAAFAADHCCGYDCKVLSNVWFGSTALFEVADEDKAGEIGQAMVETVFTVGFPDLVEGLDLETFAAAPPAVEGSWPQSAFVQKFLHITRGKFTDPKDPTLYTKDFTATMEQALDYLSAELAARAQCVSCR